MLVLFKETIVLGLICTIAQFWYNTLKSQVSWIVGYYIYLFFFLYMCAVSFPRA